MATNKNEKIQSVVSKPPAYPFGKPQARPTSSRTPQPSKIESLEDSISHLNNVQRLTFELERFGYFTIEEGDRWTQAEIDAEWARINASKEQTTHRSAAFVLNWDFKPEPEPKYHEVSADDSFLALPFAYKPDPSKQIDCEAVRAQPHVANVQDSPAYKAAVSKKRKSEEDLAVDTDAIKKKYEALQSKYYFFQFLFLF